MRCPRRAPSRQRDWLFSVLALAAPVAADGSSPPEYPPELSFQSCLREVAVRLQPTSRPVGISNDDEVTLDVSGAYCAGTPPQLTSTHVEERKIRLVTTAAGVSTIDTQPFGFSIPVGPLEAGFWTVELWVEDAGLFSPTPAATMAFGVGYSCFGIERFDVLPKQATPLDTLTIAASGIWCQGSEPTLQTIEVVGNAVRLLTVASRSGPASIAPWELEAELDPLPPGDYTAELLVTELGLGPSPQLAASRSFTVGSLCNLEGDSLCLNRGRFEVEVTWRTSDGTTGSGTPIPATADSGLFWFFDPDNVELDAKVLDACDLPGFGSYWVFVAGLTDVGVEITVTDRRTGDVWTRSTPIGTPFQPILDTAAFDCP